MLLCLSATLQVQSFAAVCTGKHHGAPKHGHGYGHKHHGPAKHGHGAYGEDTLSYTAVNTSAMAWRPTNEVLSWRPCAQASTTARRSTAMVTATSTTDTIASNNLDCCLRALMGNITVTEPNSPHRRRRGRALRGRGACVRSRGRASARRGACLRAQTSTQHLICRPPGCLQMC